MPEKVTIVGTGYVGLVTGVCLARSGHDVTCVDIDPEKVSSLAAGTPTIYEPGITEILAEGLESGRLRFATTADGWRELVSDITFVAVGTPMAENGAADLSFVRTVVSDICAVADRPFTLVMKSTVPPGTGALLKERYLADAACEISYVSNPEFLREGHALTDWFNTDRIVLGTEEDAAVEVMRRLYADIDAPVVITDVASAETIKYASNAFLSTKISFINEIANLCDAVDADIDAVAHGIGLDSRIGQQFLRAGIGYGGSCFPKDTRALDFISTMNGYQFTLLKSVIEVNNRQRILPVIHLARALPSLHDSTVAVLGLAFKPDTDDTREAPALDIIPLLREEGARVTAYDPLAASLGGSGGGIRRTETMYEALDGASAVIIATEWPEFVNADWARVRSLMADPGIVFDGRNCLDRDAVEQAGLTYMGVGRPGAQRSVPAGAPVAT